MKDRIIEILLEFNPESYSKLYKFLSFDDRVSPFKSYAQYIDGALTLKSETFPKQIYERLCNNDIKTWNISEELFLDIIS